MLKINHRSFVNNIGIKLIFLFCLLNLSSTQAFAYYLCDHPKIVVFADCNTNIFKLLAKIKTHPSYEVCDVSGYGTGDGKAISVAYSNENHEVVSVIFPIDDQNNCLNKK